jgi:hypothetical protein
MGNIFRPERHAEILSRLDRLSPKSERKWGRMTPPQAVCHLSDSFKAILLDRPLDARPVNLRRRVVRFLVFTAPMPWPKGVPTSARVDAERGGTAPVDFATDVAELKTLIGRFVESDGRTLEPHYFWGRMSRGEWGRYGYRHADHHLRQFGV